MSHGKGLSQLVQRLATDWTVWVLRGPVLLVALTGGMMVKGLKLVRLKMVPITDSGIPSFYDRMPPIKNNCVAVSLLYRQQKSGTQELINAGSVEMGQIGRAHV